MRGRVLQCDVKNQTTGTSNTGDILVVDDNRDAADALAEVLGLMGFQASVVHTVDEALARIRHQQPLCVLLDVNMPDIDGLDLARQIRLEHGDDIVLIAITGAGVEDERAAQTFAIVDHHFTKPLDIASLEQILKM